MFHASSNSNKKNTCQAFWESFGNVFHMRFQFTSFHGIPYVYPPMLYVIFRALIARSVSKYGDELSNNVFETCVPLGSARLSEMLIAIHTNLKCCAWNCITLIPCACYWHYCDSLTHWLTDWLTDSLTDLLFFDASIYVCFTLSRFLSRRQSLRYSELKFWISLNIFQSFERDGGK